MGARRRTWPLPGVVVALALGLLASMLSTGSAPPGVRGAEPAPLQPEPGPAREVDGQPLVGSEPVVPGTPAFGPVGRRLPRPTLPGRCRGAAGALGRASALLEGVWTLGGHPPVRIGLDPTWREDPLKDRNWQTKHPALLSVLDLLEAWVVTGDPRYYDRAQFLLVDWYEENPRVGAPSPWSWHPMATGQRAAVYACAAPYFPHTSWIRAALDLHGRALAEPGFYVNEGNYALNQSLGLLEVGAAVGHAGWKGLAATRINALLVRSVDADGVTNEQAPAYQSYNLSRYRLAQARLIDLGLPLAPEFARLDLMPDFLAHATLPNGYLEQIGDTHYGPAPVWKGTTSEFAATRGASGPRPAAPHRLYPAGYVFARSGWGERRAFADEVFLSLRFGPAPKIHGHADGTSLTFYGFGSRLLIDPGGYNYEIDPYRSWFKGRTAHNVVTVDGASWSRTATSKLVRHQVTAAMIDATVSTAGYPGVSQQRHVTFSRNLNYLLVEDRAIATTRRTFRQLWHLDDDAAPVVSRNEFRTTHAKGNLLVRQLIPASSSRVVRGRPAPIQGWLSYVYDVKKPAPVVEVVNTGTSVRYLTLLVPAAGRPAVTVSSLRITATGYSLVVTIGGKSERVTVSGTTASIAALN